MSYAKVEMNIDPPVFWKMTPPEFWAIHKFRKGPEEDITRDDIDEMEAKWKTKLDRLNEEGRQKALERQRG